MRVVRGLLLGIVVLGALVGGLAIAARFSGGPIGPFPGGKLSGAPGEPVTDWSAVVAGANHLELEVNPPHPRSLTTSYIVRDGTLYVPSMFAARKSWPQQVLADDRVVLRTGGRLYDRRAVRVTDPGELRLVARAFDPSTRADVDVGTLSTWYFRIEPRSTH